MPVTSLAPDNLLERIQVQSQMSVRIEPRGDEMGYVYVGLDNSMPGMGLWLDIYSYPFV